jgi:hypothetical protein
MRPIDEGRRACLISCAVARLARLADTADGCTNSEWHTAHCDHPDGAPSTQLPYHACTAARGRRRRDAAGATPAVSTQESAKRCSVRPLYGSDDVTSACHTGVIAQVIGKLSEALVLCDPSSDASAEPSSV